MKLLFFRLNRKNRLSLIMATSFAVLLLTTIRRSSSRMTFPAAEAFAPTPMFRRIRLKSFYTQKGHGFSISLQREMSSTGESSTEKCNEVPFVKAEQGQGSAKEDREARK